MASVSELAGVSPVAPEVGTRTVPGVRFVWAILFADTDGHSAALDTRACVSACSIRDRRADVENLIERLVD